MFNISQYLEKFKNIGGAERFLKETLIFLINKEVGVEVRPEDIILKNGEVIIKVSPAIKNAIFIKKEKIIKKIEEKFGRKVSEIR